MLKAPQPNGRAVGYPEMCLGFKSRYGIPGMWPISVVALIVE